MTTEATEKSDLFEIHKLGDRRTLVKLLRRGVHQIGDQYFHCPKDLMVQVTEEYVGYPRGWVDRVLDMHHAVLAPSPIARVWRRILAFFGQSTIPKAWQVQVRPDSPRWWKP